MNRRTEEEKEELILQRLERLSMNVAKTIYEREGNICICDSNNTRRLNKMENDLKLSINHKTFLVVKGTMNHVQKGIYKRLDVYDFLIIEDDPCHEAFVFDNPLLAMSYRIVGEEIENNQFQKYEELSGMKRVYLDNLDGYLIHSSKNNR